MDFVLIKNNTTLFNLFFTFIYVLLVHLDQSVPFILFSLPLSLSLSVPHPPSIPPPPFFFRKGQTSQECQPAMIYQVAEYTYFKLLKYHIDKTTINKYFRSL